MHPYSDDERANDNSETALNRMVEDRLHWQERDPEYRDHVDASFKSVDGNGSAESGATGRTIGVRAQKNRVRVEFSSRRIRVRIELVAARRAKMPQREIG